MIRHRVLGIGLDGLDVTLAERFMAEGQMPALADLRKRESPRLTTSAATAGLAPLFEMVCTATDSGPRWCRCAPNCAQTLETATTDPSSNKAGRGSFALTCAHTEFFSFRNSGWMGLVNRATQETSTATCSNSERTSDMDSGSLPIRQTNRNCPQHLGQVATQKAPFDSPYYPVGFLVAGHLVARRLRPAGTARYVL